MAVCRPVLAVELAGKYNCNDLLIVFHRTYSGGNGKGERMDVMSFCLKQVSTAALENELAKRKAQEGSKRPKLLSVKNFDGVINLCKEYVDRIERGVIVDDDLDEYIFESALTACFGEDVWEYIRTKMDK